MDARMQALAQVPLTPFFRPVPRGILQRKCACGTHTIGRSQCAECAKQKSLLQRKLAMGASNDPLEREADRIANQVLAGPAPSHVRSVPPRIRCFSGQTAGQADTAPSTVDRVLASSGKPLESALQREMGQRFGHDFSQVRVHTGTAAEHSARDVNALAYTVGRNIVFGAGQFVPGTHDGRRLIAHELTHVLQQEDGYANNRVQRFLTCEASVNCPSREPGEVASSRSDPMTVEVITSGGVGLVLTNFAVGDDRIKGDPTSNAGWNDFVASVQAGTNLRWEILGFSDCQGDEALNTRLRTARATAMFLALPADAQARVSSYGGAALDQCLRPNTSAAGRALNRSALMWVQETVYGEDEFEPETVTGSNRRRVYMCSKPLDTSPFGSHAFFRLDAPGSGNDTISLQPMLVNRTCDCWQGIPDWNYPSDVSAPGTCALTTFSFPDLYREFQVYPIGHYCTLGPNSNTFVGHIARNLGMSNPDPDGVTPGIDDAPPPWGTFAPDKWATLTGCVTKECLCPPDAEGPRDTETA